MKLTKAQRAALDKLTHGWQCAYEMQVTLPTLRSLRRFGLVDSRYDVGSFSSPRLCIMWRLRKEEEG